MSIVLISEGSQILHNDGRNDPILAAGRSA